MSALLEDAFEPPLAAPAPTGPPPPPIQTFKLRRALGDSGETELVIQTFDDRVLVIVTQNDKVGCLTQASLPPVHPLLAPPPAPAADNPKLAALPPPPASIALTPLLGSAPSATAHDVYVSQIATLVWWSLQLGRAARRPVVVGLALKRIDDDEHDKERERFAGVMDMVAAWPGPQ